jgi:hypothetical protein
MFESAVERELLVAVNECLEGKVHERFADVSLDQ